MVRVTAWTVGLYGAGATIAHAFPNRWVEPVVLLALGLVFLFVSARMGVKAALPVATLSARAPAPAPGQAPAAAPVPVEQSA